MDRHPRTVVGVTKNHSFFVLVFSGRSKTSVGANYLRLSEVAKQLIPDIDFLINEDGGGSSLLAYLRGHKLTEISLPAPSEGSLTGQARSFSSMIEIIL